MRIGGARYGKNGRAGVVNRGRRLHGSEQKKRALPAARRQEIDARGAVLAESGGGDGSNACAPQHSTLTVCSEAKTRAPSCARTKITSKERWKEARGRNGSGTCSGNVEHSGADFIVVSSSRAEAI